MTPLAHAVFIEPTYEVFLQDRLFDTGSAFLNRDNQLLPFVRARQVLQAQGIPMHTADYLRSGQIVAKNNHYWSLGSLSGYQSLLNGTDVKLRGFVLFEPPLVAPRVYRALGEITRHFDATYVHNTTGDGYCLQEVNASRLRKFRMPQPYDAEVEPFWNRETRLNKLVVIAGNHNPRFRRPELYSRRIEAVAELVGRDAIDLYGRGWDKWWSRHSAWLPYWRHRKALMRAYRGACDSKLDVLSRYRFSLCLENVSMRGYLTEKLFDCLYAGTVPVYLGAPDIADLVPPDAFVDLRNYPDNNAMFNAVSNMPDAQWQRMRDAGRAFLRTTGKRLHYDFLTNILTQEVL